MSNVNYIDHWNAVMHKLMKINSKPPHFSLYMALFNKWNACRFKPIMEVSRAELMKDAKISSNATYYKYLKELEVFDLLVYEPSHAPHIGSKVKMKVMSKVSFSQEYQEQSFQEFLMNRIANSKDEAITNAFKRTLVKYFKEQHSDINEAEKFYNHYESIAWKKSGQTITDWKPLAKNWIIRSKEQARSKPKPEKNPLYVPRNKNYNEPL